MSDTNESTTPTIAEELRKSLRVLTRATIALYLVVLALFIAGYLDAANRRDALSRVATSTNSALCTLRGDLERRVTDTQAFLKKHPQGGAGISRAQIQMSVKNQRSTIDALGVLRCDKGK